VGHNDNTNCIICHPHQDGFKPTCGSCHELPPPTGTHLKHFGGQDGQAFYGGTEITQDFASQETVYIMNCGNCHPLDFNQHFNNVPNSGGGSAQVELYNPSAPPGSIKAMNPPTAAYTPGGTVFTGPSGLDYTQGTCSNVYCHSYTKTTTTGPVPEPTVPPYAPPLVYDPPWETLVSQTREYTSPTWGVDSLSCGGCHEYPIINELADVSAGAGDSHGWRDDFGYNDLHVWNMGFGPLQCSTCHFETVRAEAVWTQTDFDTTFEDIPIFNTANHVNGSKEIVFTNIPILYPTSIGDVYHDPSTGTYDPATKTCSNMSCHKNQTEVKWGTPYRFWNSWECNVCHQI
jgi:predicted CxxxxCH...CXXCH cytochrome family protein